MILELTSTLFYYWIANALRARLTSRPTRGFSSWFWCLSWSANLDQKWEKGLSHPSWSQISQRFLPAASDSLELNLEQTTTAKLTEASNRSNGHIVLGYLDGVESNVMFAWLSRYQCSMAKRRKYSIQTTSREQEFSPIPANHKGLT